MVGYTVTIYAASGKVWVMADWEQDGRKARLVECYGLEAGRSARTSLLALKLADVERQVAIYARAWRAQLAQVRVDWRLDWATAEDHRTIDAVVASLKAHRADEPPWPGSG